MNIQRYALVMIIGFLPDAALAADIPNSRSTPATLTANDQIKIGSFERAGDSDWYEIQLTKGVSYAIRIDSGPPFNAEDIGILARVRNANGTVLASGIDDPDTVGGFTYTATTAGRHYIEYKHVAGLPLPSGYEAKVDTDCTASRTTKCTLALAKRRNGVFNYAQDVDWFKVSLVRTRTYTLSGDGEIGFYANIANSAGNLIRSSWEWLEGTSFSFRPPADGTYYILTGGEDDFDYNYWIMLR